MLNYLIWKQTNNQVYVQASLFQFEAFRANTQASFFSMFSSSAKQEIIKKN